MLVCAHLSLFLFVSSCICLLCIWRHGVGLCTRSPLLFSFSSSPTSCNLLTSLAHFFLVISLSLRFLCPQVFTPIFLDSLDEGNKSWSLFSFGIYHLDVLYRPIFRGASYVRLSQVPRGYAAGCIKSSDLRVPSPMLYVLESHDQGFMAF